MNLKVDLVWTCRRHLSDILEIERQRDNPWPADEFIYWLRRRKCIGKVAYVGDKVVGHMLYILGERHFELLNLAVHSDFRRQGVGRAMVASLIHKLNPEKRTSVQALVRDGNLGCQLFLRAIGFRAISVLETPYCDSPDDGYLFVHGLQPRVRIAGDMFSSETWGAA